MIKSLLVVTLLCGPALAAPRATTKPITATLTIKSGKDVRTHDVMMVVHECGRISDKASDHEDTLKVCAVEDAPQGVQLDVDWVTHSASSEYHNMSTVVIARGGNYEFGTTGMRLAIALQ